MPRNAVGKLPYDIRLHAPEEKRKKLMGFGQAVETARSTTSGGRKSSQKSKTETSQEDAHADQEANPSEK